MTSGDHPAPDRRSLFDRLQVALARVQENFRWALFGVLVVVFLLTLVTVAVMVAYMLTRGTH
jgi:hypothetical protein